MQLFMLAQSHIDNDFCVEFNINYINKCFQIVHMLTNWLSNVNITLL